MRAAQEAREAAEALALQEEVETKQREIDRLRAALELRLRDREAVAKRRGADATPNGNRKAGKTK
jgi:hypothetical protein